MRPPQMLDFIEPENRAILAAVEVLDRAVAAFADPTAHLPLKREYDPFGREPLLQLGNSSPVHGGRADDDRNGFVGNDCEGGDQGVNQTELRPSV